MTPIGSVTFIIHHLFAIRESRTANDVLLFRYKLLNRGKTRVDEGQLWGQ